MLADAEIESSNDGLSSSRLSKNCLNCEEVLDGEFCKMCGQAASTERYSLRSLFDEVYAQFRKIEAAKTLKTIWTLFVSPGSFVRGYLVGKRVDHINPVRYFIYCFLIEVAVKIAVGWFFPLHPIAGRTQSGVSIELLNFGLTIVWGLLWSAIYYKEELNLVEYIVAAVYFVSQSFILSVILIAILLPFTQIFSSLATTYSILDLSTYFLYSCYFAYSFFSTKLPMLILKQLVVLLLFSLILLSLSNLGFSDLFGIS